jgi:hypothetical protein
MEWILIDYTVREIIASKFVYKGIPLRKEKRFIFVVCKAF